MAFGSTPFVTDDLDKLIRKRLHDVLRSRYGGDPTQAALAEGVIPNPLQEGTPHDMGPLSPTLNAMGPPASAAPRPGFGKRALALIGSSRGQRGIGAGIRAGRASQNFGEGLLSGLGASLEAGTAYDASQAEAERRAKVDANKAQLDEIGTLSGLIPKERAAGNTSLNTLEGMRGAGFTDERIRALLSQRGAGGAGGGSGRLTDLQRVAQGLVAVGRAKSLDEGYVLARTMLQQPQPVGSISRVTIDPNTFNTTTTRVSVSRRLNQLTNDFETIDPQGNIVTEQDMQTFQANPGGYQGGTGGAAGGLVAPPPPPPAPMAPVASHAVTPGLNPLSDFKPGLAAQPEEQILADLQDPSILQDPRGIEIVRLYAAGRGPGGNSTRIKQTAAQILAAAPR